MTAWPPSVLCDYHHPVFGAIRVTGSVPPDAAFYPVTIVQARYGGTYEPGSWLAFPCDPYRLDRICREWDGDDIACADFWEEARAHPAHWPIGAADTPSAALDALLQALVSASNVYTNSHSR